MIIHKINSLSVSFQKLSLGLEFFIVPFGDKTIAAEIGTVVLAR